VFGSIGFSMFEHVLSNKNTGLTPGWSQITSPGHGDSIGGLNIAICADGFNVLGWQRATGTLQTMSLQRTDAARRKTCGRNRVPFGNLWNHAWKGLVPFQSEGQAPALYLQNQGVRPTHWISSFFLKARASCTWSPRCIWVYSGCCGKPSLKPSLFPKYDHCFQYHISK